MNDDEMTFRRIKGAYRMIETKMGEITAVFVVDNQGLSFNASMSTIKLGDGLLPKIALATARWNRRNKEN
jgi:hypothetical protein